METRIQNTDNQISEKKAISAKQRKELMKLKQDCKKQLAVYECSIILFQREQEATLSRKSTINFIKSNSNMYLFYRTIENRLQALFHSALAAQGPYLQTVKTTNYGTAATVINMIPVSGIPFGE